MYYPVPLRNDDSTLIGQVASDKIDNDIYPLSKLMFGAEGDAIYVSASNPLPTGLYVGGSAVSNSNPVPISDGGGTVSVDDGGASLTVDGSVSVSGSVSLGQYTPVSGRLPVDGSGVTQPVSGTFWQTTQPVSHASGSQVDGHSATIGAKADAAAASDTATASQVSLFKRLLQQFTTFLSRLPSALTGSGNLKVSVEESATLAVSGTIDATQSGTWDIGTLGTITNPVKISDNGGSITVDATALPLPTGAATSAKQPALGTAGSPSTDVLTMQGAVGMTPVKVDGSAVTQPVSGPLTDTQLRASAVNIAGTVTANAGTNLNTSALALESGGNLAAAATSLGVMDDWDESDRAKVNLIVGHAGVSATAGAVDAGTLRTTLASDDPAVVKLGTIDTSASAAATSLGLLDDAVYTDGSGTPSKGLAVMGTDGTNPQILSTNATGHVNIADGGNSITVDGTVAISGSVTVNTHAVTQSGTWDLRNVSGTISLPTGAATAAKQPAFGVAGTPSADVLTIQGDPAMTPLHVIVDSGVTSGGLTDTELRASPVDVAGPLTDTELRASAVPVSLASVPSHAVTDGGGSLTVDGTVAATQSGTWTVTGSGGTFPVTDSGGSLTVDAPVGTPVFVRLSDGTNPIATLPVSGTFWQTTQPVSGTVAATQSGTWTVTGAGGSFPVTDSGGTLTVDAPVGTPVFVRLSDGTSAIATLPVSLASVPSHAVTNAGTFAVQAAQSGTWNVTNISGTVSLPTGAATETTLAGVLTTSDFDSKTGSLTETAPASDTASSGLNGRLQRIAQRLTSLITALGSPFQAGGSIGNTSFASTVADGANVTLGSKADAKSTATDTTAITAMSVLKQISASVQAPPSQAVTNAGTFAVQVTSAPSTAVTNAGTFAVQAAQSGTWTVQPGNTANTTAWLVKQNDATATTGNLTAADAASTSIAGVSSQVIYSGTPTNNSALSAAVTGAGSVAIKLSGTFSATTLFEQSFDGGTTWVSLYGVVAGLLPAAVVTQSTLAGQVNCSLNGATHVRTRCVTYVSGTVAVSIQPALSSATQYQSPMGYQVASGGNGATDAGTQRFTLSNDSTGQVKLAAGTASVGKIIPEGSASGVGTSSYRNTALSNTDQAIKGSSGRLYQLQAYNPNTVDCFIHLYDASTASVGTSTTPTRTYRVPARTAFILDADTIPQAYATAITIAASTTNADASAAPTTGLEVQAEYI